MAHTTNDLFCPLYKEVIEQKPWESVLNANQGLLFDKFASGWQKQGTTFEFDKAGEPKGQWLRNFASKIAGDKTLLTEACTRQRNLVEKMGGKTMLLTNTSRFITGMGREHPLDNGFTWHHTLGVPYLPGSSLKGVLRAWYRENGTWDEAKEKWGIWNPNTRRMEDDKAINQLFGSQEKGVGQFILLDILPSKPPQLVVEIMTPHYGDYYRDYQDKNGQTAPGDWLSPNPITFLAVEADQSWQLAVLPGPSRRSINSEDINNLQSELLKAFAWLGAGAKTAIGYGRFEQDLAAEEELKQRIEREEQDQSQREEEAAQEAEFQQSMQADSKPLQQLKVLQRARGWALSAGNTNMTSALATFADQNPQPPQDCLDWIRDLLDSIPNYKGVWEDPDAKKGKKKNKPKYQSATIRNLVKKLNPDHKDT